MEKDVLVELPSLALFRELLRLNPGLVVIRLTSSNCAACRRIDPLVESFFASSPAHVLCVDLTVEDPANRAVYAWLRSL